ncbi:uncharacterized protein [Salminus brasiliensis]|uniref:uncharacterized protein n=1 Tax=Salminus brasiliensis TaxID=930266 RepID=UPI003B8342C9
MREMSLSVYEDVSSFGQLNSEDLEDLVVVVYESTDTVTGHDPDTEMEYTSLKKKLQLLHSGFSSGDTAGSRCYRLAAVFLGLLCVLLLAAITLLWINFTNLTAERDQLHTSYTNLTAERDQLQTSYTNLTAERDQLQGERDELQKRLSEPMLHQGWRRFRSSLYSITTEKTGWSGTRIECQRRGGDLVIINSREEQEFLNKEFGSSEAWIGLSDSEKEGEWKWVDGSALTTKFWWGEEPNDYEGKEDCGVTGYKGATPGAAETWADVPCLHSTVGICEKPSAGV